MVKDLRYTVQIEFYTFGQTPGICKMKAEKIRDYINSLDDSNAEIKVFARSNWGDHSEQINEVK